MDVTEKGWFKQWQHTVFANIEQAFVWGADDVTLLGIKGDLEKNYATLEEWPRLLENMQAMLKQSRVKGAQYDKISEMRIALPKLKRQLEHAEGKSYIIIASCPSSQFAEAMALAQAASEPRNIFCAWGRADDVSGGLEDPSIGGVDADRFTWVKMEGTLPECDQYRPNEFFLDGPVDITVDEAKRMCEAVPDCNCLVVDPRGKPFWFHGKKGFKLVGATFKRSPWDFYYITERLVDDDDDYGVYDGRMMDEIAE